MAKSTPASIPKENKTTAASPRTSSDTAHTNTETVTAVAPHSTANNARKDAKVPSSRQPNNTEARKATTSAVTKAATMKATSVAQRR